jgi:hypothetical protein
MSKRKDRTIPTIHGGVQVAMTNNIWHILNRWLKRRRKDAHPDRIHQRNGRKKRFLTSEL